jgi:hypothetical protein
MISNTCLAMVPLIVPSATSLSSSAASAGETGLSVDALAARFSAPNSSARPSCALLRLAPALEQGIEPARGLDLGGQHAGIVRRDAEPS